MNDINRSYVQTLAEHSPEDKLQSVYEYGVQRTSYTDYTDSTLGTVYSYAYDGRGSVSNLTLSSGESAISYLYDPYGNSSV